MDDLTAFQFREWEAYNAIEPIDDVNRIECHLASIAMLITDIMSALYSKGGSKKTKLTDFIIDWESIFTGEVGPTQSTSEMKSILIAMAKAQNKAVSKNSKNRKGGENPDVKRKRHKV